MLHYTESGHRTPSSRTIFHASPREIPGGEKSQRPGLNISEIQMLILYIPVELLIQCISSYITLPYKYLFF